MKLSKEEIMKLESFFEDIKEVYRKHGYGLGHEDGHGSFLIEKLEKSHEVDLDSAFQLEAIMRDSLDEFYEYMSSKKEPF